MAYEMEVITPPTLHWSVWSSLPFPLHGTQPDLEYRACGQESHLNSNRK